ncbi:uncharacterized protein Dwil_GK22796 [Drosophila willistoni]|uniref:Protein krueppel n=1 Tax=Drosophila willistoni TaxID=7260 RepID=B4NGC1_DROWI|nr:zinc finger protein 112 [Drosophila willistoni]EDW83338.1 uncharacterized protein Dwil_GK22796 [Drosophila willistoni]
MKPDSIGKWIVCRVCLNSASDGEYLLQDIFSQNASTRLDQMLYICAGIPVSIDDNFPDKMCSKCVSCLRQAYKFRLACQRSYQHIMDLFASEETNSSSSKNSNTLETKNFIKLLHEESDQLEQVKMEIVPLQQQQQQHEEIIVSYVEEALVEEQEEEEEEDVDQAYEMDDDDDFVVYDKNQTVVSVEEAFQEHAEVEEYEEVEVLSPEATSSFIVSVKLEGGNNVIEEVASNEDDDSNSSKPAFVGRTSAKPKLLSLRGQHNDEVQQAQPVKKLGRKQKEKLSNYICDVCANIYPTQARLTEHMKFHSGVKPHECEICGRGFVQNQQLVRHMNTHTGNRPYKCNYCPAAFADRSTKTKHHRIHTKERPYECDVCFRTFSYSDNLKFHKMIHTGEKPHVCDLCGKGFVKAYKMRLHRVTHEKRGPCKPSTNPATPDDIKDEMSTFVST